MTLALLALMILLPLELMWRARLSLMAAPVPVEPRPKVGSVLPSLMTLFIFGATVVGCIAIAVVVNYRGYIDDAFISYRYSLNLTNGSGLVWNAGEAPVEGFTNILLVFIVAPFLALGVDPLLVTRILSFVGLGLTSVLIYRLGTRHLGFAPFVAALLAIAYPMIGRSIENALSGLETVLFMTALFGAFYQAVRFIDTQRNIYLWITGALCFVAFLLRPEAVFLVIAIPGTFLLVSRFGELRQSVVALVVTFALPLVMFLLWKYWYFGTIVPNPALIKIPAAGLIFSRKGVESIVGYLMLNWKLLIALLVALTIPTTPRGAVSRLLASLLIAIFVIFYLRVDTLMDVHNRFLYPITPFLYFLGLPAFGALMTWLLGWNGSLITKVSISLVVAFAALFSMPEGPKGYLNLAKAGPSYGTVEEVLGRIAHKLQAFDGIEKITIASQDAGLIPYFTRVRHIDTAGLNDRYIARERDPRKLSDYVFHQHPDLIIFRSRKDGTLLTYAHGPLGDQTKWSDNPGWDEYEYVGTVDQPEIHDLQFFVRRDSPVAFALARYIKTNVAEHVEDRSPVKLGTAQ
jgi:arabinofuranosyltransferase